MARAATTTDVFNAIAEAHRRDILDALVDGEVSVGELVERLELAQPQVSKHLKVLAEVGLVRVRAAGRNRLYRLEAPALAPLQRWLATYEQLINARYDRLGDYLAELQAERQAEQPEPSASKPSASKKGNPS
ncbi:MAG TPA: metalloregulator ArsR/SmtB family transcription factor [Ilumatobacter sp.]